ncbi:hypothetical protein MSBR3_3443 [Methanosarcina barkeri 3]|uniref:Uncharacterized protein n=1 Tax=Methanosarcina barkeri 3 TaxID=1434107 RepID=A0A0E3SNE5_METBA|nr:hypothetical protein [Methanosarcina barkeri]AKB84021.1 hypothetical protein MSBR3_3443 [Methanosarcina barkeri 3]
MKTIVSRSIREILEEFLSEQQARLSSKTSSWYEEAIYYFEEYLNGWAHPVKDYSETLDNFFIITGIKPGKHWFESFSDGRHIGPVPVLCFLRNSMRTGFSLGFEKL